MAEEERILEVTPDFDVKRIDQCLAASFSDCSRSFLQKLLKDGKVSINGKTQKASSKVAAGDAVLLRIGSAFTNLAFDGFFALVIR